VFAGQMGGGAVGPSGYDGFAGFVCFNLSAGRWLIDLGKGKAVALLDVEDRVVAEHERGAFLLLVRRLLVVFPVLQLLVEHNRSTFFVFAHRAF
jgi:hypothetical protein